MRLHSVCLYEEDGLAAWCISDKDFFLAFTVAARCWGLGGRPGDKDHRDLDGLGKEAHHGIGNAFIKWSYAEYPGHTLLI